MKKRKLKCWTSKKKGLSTETHFFPRIVTFTFWEYVFGSVLGHNSALQSNPIRKEILYVNTNIGYLLWCKNSVSHVLMHYMFVLYWDFPVFQPTCKSCKSSGDSLKWCAECANAYTVHTAGCTAGVYFPCFSVFFIRHSFSQSFVSINHSHR